MSRQCAVPGCMVLLASAGPFCTRHFAKVPPAVAKALHEARVAEAKAGTKGTPEYQAAFDVALSYATATFCGNTPMQGVGVVKPV